MASYSTDLQDIRFLLFEYLRLGHEETLPVFGDFDCDDYEMFLTEGYRFAQEVLAPINSQGDREGVLLRVGAVCMPSCFVEAYQKYREGGWVACAQPSSIGGTGLPLTVSLALHEFFLGACVAFTLTPGLSEGLISLIHRFGNDGVKNRFLDGLVDGRWTGTMCMTESSAGSDVGASKATASKMHNGRYRIQGEKLFITGGDHNLCENIIHAVLARVDGAPAGSKGLSVFLVPKHRIQEDGSLGGKNDITTIRIEEKLGIKASPTCLMMFGENKDCEGYLLGEENDGLKIMFHMMNDMRLMVGLQGLAVASGAYHQALEYAHQRLQGTKISEMRDPKASSVPIIEHPEVRRMLLWQKSVTQGLRALIFTTGWYTDRTESLPEGPEKDKYTGFVELLTPVCKAYASDMGCRCVDLALQVLGGYGYITDYQIEQHYRDARIAPIYEGTNEIQALDLVGRKLGLQKGKVLMSYLKDISLLCKKVQEYPPLFKLGKELSEAAQVLGEQAMRFMSVGSQEPQLVALHAKRYMQSFGEMATASCLLRCSLQAQESLETLFAKHSSIPREKLLVDNPMARFYHNKIVVTQFFFREFLPLISLRANSFRYGESFSMDCKF